MRNFYLILAYFIIISANSKATEFEYALDFNNYYGYTDYSKTYNKLYKNNNINSSVNLYLNGTYDFSDNYKVSLTSYFMVDSAKEVENYNQGTWGEEVYATIDSSFGELTIGQANNVAYDFAVGAPNIGNYRVNNTDIVNFITNPNWYKKGSKYSYKTLNSTYINTDGASVKTNYITPEYSGIKIGATYIPKVYSQTGLVSKDAKYKNKEAYVLGAYGYWDIWGYELETSLGYADYRENDKEYSLGLSVYHKGWTVGASYRETKADNMYIVDEENLFDAYREGSAYNIGISYEFGPLTTGVSYFKSKANNFNNKDEIISFSNSLEYNKYATISFTASHLKSKGNNNNIDENSKGYAFILGLELSL